MTKTPLEIAQTASSDLHSLIVLIDPRARNAIGPLKFADDHSKIVRAVKSCIDRLQPVDDLDIALSSLAASAPAYALYYNGSLVNDPYSDDVVGCYQEMCRMHLRVARAHIERAISNKQLGE